MSVTANLEESPVSIEPGGEATVSVQVLNSGTTVEEFRFEVVGPCAAWTTVGPQSVSLLPGHTDTTTLTLRPPRSPHVAPGQTPLGLRITPSGEPGQAVVSERTVTVLPFTDITAELVPRTSHSVWRGRHKVAVDNTGNVPLTALLTTREADGRARPTFDPPELEVPPGEARFAALHLRPNSRLWRGTPITHPFQAVVAAKPVDGLDRPDPVHLDGTYEQQAILPSWLPRALIAAVLIGAAVVGLWFTVLRPTVRSAAREAADKQLAGSTSNASAGTDGKGKPGSSAGSGSSSGTGASSGASGGPGGSGGSGGSGGGIPRSAQLQIQDAVSGDANTMTAYTVPDGHTFELTDLLVQNPQGDAGTLIVSAQGGRIINLAMENFRDFDYHLVTPIEVLAGRTVIVSVNCRDVGKPVKAPAPSTCEESVLLGGTLRADS
jgi:hypothetical protein